MDFLKTALQVLYTFNLVNRKQINELKTKGKLFVIHENYLCDVSEFINTHPGGRVHLEETLFTDVSRCVTGTVAVNNKFEPHDHSYKARMQLMNLAFAELVEDHDLVLLDKKR